MAKIFKINDDNQIVIIALVIFLLTSVLFYVIYPPLREATGIYGFLTLICLGIYTNPAFQEYLNGIAKNRKTFFFLLLGLGLGALFIVIPKILPGFSMGLPLVPASVDSDIRWVIQCVFAPGIEDILRFGVLGLILFLFRKKGISKGELWFAIFTQALFFTALHALAYYNNWYNAPSIYEAFAGLSAVSGSLIFAFLFASITGFLVTRRWCLNLILSISSHYAINQTLFVDVSVVGLNIVNYLPLILNNILSIL